ncbi:MAG: flagellar hook-associated protein FlgK [Candidatus Zixiibacteriota bacterium]|nr:MAG: flagellar hook-associated protein FlgK [candidate division Zixibacteria bacterium]
MAGLMQGLEIGRRALLTNQAWLQTIGHNIANANTPGYRRQRVTITTSYPELSANGPIGSGVQVSNIRHMRDLFLGKQYREATKELGNWSYKEKTLSQMEAVFNEPQDSGLANTLNEFWNAWSQLSTDPNSTSSRESVIQSANLLIDRLKHVSNNLSDQRSAIDADLVNLTSEVNRLTSEIAKLNQQIKAIEIGNIEASDLRDMRDKLTNDLSSIVDVNVIDKANGGTIVSMGAMVLVDSSDSFDISVRGVRDGARLTHELVWKGTDVKLKNLNGQMAGLLESRDELIPDYISRLDELARTVVERVNELHVGGYGLNGSTGVSFFDPDFTTAAGIRLNQEIVNDNNLIAVSASSDVDVLDGEVALAIADLQYSQVMSNNSASMNDYYNTLVGNLGIDTREATSFANNYELLAHQINNQKQSVEGVSLDEEMANMIRFQHAYDAAARVIVAMDGALDTVINTMGILGR